MNITVKLKKLLLLLISATLNAEIEIHQSAGTTSLSFLKIPVGARPSAIQTFTGIADDIYSIYFNPAGLTNLDQNKEFTGMHNEYFQDIRHDFLAFSFPLFGGNFATSILALYTQKDLEYRQEPEERDVLTLPERYFNAYDIAFIISYAKKVNQKLSVGSNLKLIEEVIDIDKADTFAFDFSCLYKYSEILSFGTVVGNVGPSIKFIEKSFLPPMNIRVGVGYRPKSQLLIGSDLYFPIDNFPSISFGLEFSPYDFISLRAGYKYRFTGNEIQDIYGISAGLGIKHKNFYLDYAFLPFGFLGNSHRISIKITFSPRIFDSPSPKA